MIVMCVLLFLTPIFRLMPYNTMAAIIIVGVLQLVEIPIGVDLFRVSTACDGVDCLSGHISL